jgi:hypothetical protein
MSILSETEGGSANAAEVTKTPSGIPIDYGFSKAAPEVMIQRAAEALRKHNFDRLYRRQRDG